MTTLTIAALSQKYQVNQGKPHFPLNTLRLVYLIFAESIAAQDVSRVERRAQDILALIPLVQGLLDARSGHRAENAEATLESEWEAVQPALQEIYAIIDTPSVRQTFEQMFSFVFPMQDTLLLSLYNDLSAEKKFGIQDIYTIFHIRSMDSILYSGLVGEVVRRDTDPAELPANFQLAINYKLNALYQLNDLVDAIVYAKDDMAGGNFSPFELIRKAASDASEAKEFITSMAAAFERRIQTFALGADTERLISEFGHTLVGVIGGGASTARTAPSTPALPAVDEPATDSFAVEDLNAQANDLNSASTSADFPIEPEV